MPDDIEPILTEEVTNQQDDALPKKTSFQRFLKFSGFTLIFVGIAIILMIAGLVIFYRTGEIVKENAGFWLALSGVIIFLFTVIFGFERPVEES